MPVVASVEEEQPLVEPELPSLIVASTENNEEKIDFVETNVPKPPEKKTRSRSRSARSRRAKRQKPIEDADEESLLLMKLITEEHIDQCLRTLFTSTSSEKSRSRTQPTDETKNGVFDILTSANTNETSNMSSAISESSAATTTEQQNST